MQVPSRGAVRRPEVTCKVGVGQRAAYLGNVCH